MVVCASCGEENPERARFCLACGEPLEATAPTGEERKVVSVLFVDLVGFTSSSDRADPEDVRATLRPYHERVKSDIERFGGTVEKFIGDAVMAVFGAPVSHEDDAERAVRSALRVLDTIEEMRGEGLELAVRAAVASGEAVVALGARPERGEAIVAGDVVNTAARLQGSAATGTIIVDEVTMRSADSAIVFEPLEPVVAKGKSEPIPVWRALEARGRVGEPETATATPFVGREHERQLLLETFLRVERESTPQLVTLVGEPGVGKSRLVTELRATLDDRPDLITWRNGRCPPYGEGITFWALGDVVKAEAGILESDDEDEAAAKLEQAVAPLFEDASEREWLTSRLAPLVGAGGDGGAVGRDEAFAAWRRFLEAMAARRSFVFVVEDVHWADEALLDFLEHLLDWAAPVPLLVLATARPELYDRRPGWSGGKRNATTISVSPLSSDETARLLQGLLQRGLLPAETQASILERAGGNPLYTEQFARMLSERGNASELLLPEGVQALIAARLDTLPTETKGLLQDASVVGRTFWTGAVAAIGGRDAAAVQSGIRELVRREFVRPVRVSSVKGQDELSIWHALVRDVAYQQIPRALRAEKHVAAAAWIEQTAHERVADHAEILVHHYDQALELAQAAGEERPESERSLVRYLLLAGDRAMSLDIPAAEAYYRRALARIADDVERARVLVKLGDGLQPQGRLPESEAAYEEAIPTLLAAGDRRGAGLAMVNLGRALWRHGDTVRARAVSVDAVALLEEDRDSTLVLAYGRLAAVEALGGRSEQAIEWANKSVDLAREIEEENIARPLGMRGIARIDLGDPGGMDDLRSAVDVALALDLPAEDTAIAYGNLGENVRLAEGVAPGRALVETGLEFARNRGHVHHVMYSRRVLLIHLFHEGRWDRLLEEADEVIEWDRKRGGTQIEPWALVDLGLVLAHRGEATKASQLVHAALPRAREIADPQTILPLLATAAVVELSQGDAIAAGVLLAEHNARRGETRPRTDDDEVVWLVTVAVGIGNGSRAEAVLSYEPWSALGQHSHTHGRALLAEEAGRREEAAQLFAEAADGWQEWGSVPFRAYALLGLGNCSGDAAALAEGNEIFASLGATPATAQSAPLRQQQV